MPENNLGQYKVVVSGDYTQFAASIDAVLKSVQSSADQMTARMSAMTDAVSRSMAGMSAAVSGTAAATTAQMTAMNAAFGAVNASGAAQSINSVRSATQSLAPAADRAAHSVDGLSQVFQKMRTHAQWIVTAGLTAAIDAIPVAISHVIEKTEALDAKIRQNLELSDEYHGNNQKLDDDMKRLAATANTYAIGFGADINEVQEAMQILSRRFKDVESISYLTSVALTMNRLDFVDLKKGASDLEAVMLQFGLSAQQTKQFLNDFTVAVHTARITGTDLLDALERSGSAFKAFGMDARSSIAAISALSTETARTGSTIGNTFKSIAANFDTKKAVEALQAYDIQLYTTNANGMKIMRDGANVFGELQNLFQKLDDEGKRKLAMSLAGGKFQVNQLQAFLADANQNFSKIMDEMKNKSSDEMTQELLKTQMDTYATKIMQMKASFEVFARTIGSMVLPALKDFTIYLTGLGNWLTQHAGAVLGFTQGLLYMAGGYLIVKTAAVAYSIGVGLVDIAMAAYTGTVSLATVGTWAFNAANIAASISTTAAMVATRGLTATLYALWTAMGPVGWVTLAIIGLGAAIYEVYTHWDSVKPALIAVWNGIVETVARAVEIVLKLMPGLAVAIYAVHEVWCFVIDVLKEKWNSFTEFLSAVGQVIYRLITDVSKAWGPFVAGAQEGIKNFAAAIGEVVTSILPAWANSVLKIIGELANKIDAIATRIGNRIRDIFKIAATGGTGGGGGGDEESPFQKALREAREAFEKMLKNNTVPGITGGEPPSIGNQIPEGGHHRTGGAGETAYAQAKKQYEAAAARAEADAAIAGQKFTLEQKLALYHEYMDGVAKIDNQHHQETADYEKNLYTLITQSTKEKLDLKKAQLEKSIAEEKLLKRGAFEEEIKLMQDEVNNTLAGSVDRVKAETAVLNKKREYENYVASISKKEIEINKQHMAAVQSLMDKQDEYALKNKKITEEQLLAKQMQRNESTYSAKKGDVVTGLQSTATSGNASAMTAAYDAYTSAVTEDDRKMALSTMLTMSKNEQATLDYIAKGEQAFEAYAQKRIELEQKAYEYVNRYQISLVNGFQSGVSKSLDGILNRTMSWAAAMRNIFSSLVKSIEQQWINDMATKWTQTLSKMVMGQKDASKQIIGYILTENGQKQAVYAAGNVEKMAAQTQANTKEVAMNSDKNAVIKADDAAANQAAIKGTQAAMVQMLEMMAIMYAISALFGGGGDDSSSSTSSVSLGRSASSFYMTPAAVPQLTVPAFDTGAMCLPEDMLAVVHKNEMILTPELAENIRNLGSGGGGDTNRQQRPLVMNTSINASAIDGRGMKQAFDSSSRDMAATMKKEVRRFNTKFVR